MSSSRAGSASRRRRGSSAAQIVALLLGVAALAASAAPAAPAAAVPAAAPAAPALPAAAAAHSLADTQFDFWLLALFWPPSLVAPAAQSRARHAVIRHEAATGFWTHGLWPVSQDKRVVEFCSKQHLDPRNLAGFEPSLRFYLRSGDARADAGGAVQFWDHEWLRHGTCSNLDQLGYFLTLFHASSLTDPAAAMRAVGVLPSNLQPYSLQQINAALAAVFGDSFNVHVGLKCGSRSGDARVLLQEVRLCLAKDGLGPYNCSAQWVSPGISADTCGADPAAPIWVPEYIDAGAELGFPWGMLSIIGGAVSVLALLLAGGWWALKQTGRLPSVFTPRQVRLVHYDLVHTPVRVLCEPVDMDKLWRLAPYIAEFVEDLPVGMGIKGGIARKLLKELYGTPEAPGTFDVDVLVFIDRYSPADRRAARELVTGMRLGGLVLEPKDVEVLTKEWLREYFTSRDITLNEVLILKQGPDSTVFYYTRDALRDAQLQLIRPSVHALKSEFNLNWQVEPDDGTPYVSPSQLCRCLVRYLKGHGLDYALDAATWSHYRRERLNKMQLFKVLRPFHDDGVQLQTAVDHLIDIGFLSRRDVLRAGGASLLWGLLLQEVNATIVQAGTGGRLTLGELDADGVELWVDHKKAQVASKLIANEMRGRRTGFVAADEGVEDLGLLFLPAELEAYIASGPTFDASSRLEHEADAARAQLSQSFTGTGASPAVAMPSSKRLWAAQRSVTEASSDALLSIARASLEPAGPSPASAWVSSSPQLATLGHMLSAEADATDEAAASAARPAAAGQHGGRGEQSPEPSRRRLESLESLKRLTTERSNKAFMQHTKHGGSTNVSRQGSSTVLDLPHDGSHHASPSPPPPCAGAGAGPASMELDDSEQRVWLRCSQVGTCWTEQGLDAQAQLGTWYQCIDAAGALEDGDREYAELIADDERPSRNRPPLLRLLNFALGVALTDCGLLVAAYGLLLLGLAFRLGLPRVEGAIFDAFSNLEMDRFHWNLGVAVGLVVADVAFSFTGRVALEVFARESMSTLFAAFFDHVLSQEATFFARLPAGELMARTSGDSLTLRSMFTSTTYQLVEGSALVLGSTGCLLLTLGPLWWRAPTLAVTLLFGLTLSGLEGFATGLAARALNRRVRQSLGRMMGFTLDIFSKMDCVGALSLEPRLMADYRHFARGYFSNTFKLNTLLCFHRSYTFAIAAAVRGAMLWFGGAALFADLTTVGTLFMLLRYVTMMQRGIKQASDAYARVMASIGSLERVVELHDRGTFRDAAKSLGREYLPVVPEHEEQDSWAAAPGGDGNGGLRDPLLVKLGLQPRWRWWWQRKPEMRMQLLPHETRPDFSQALGGVRLEGVHLTLRSKTDRLVLVDASLELLAGEAAIITGAPGGGKSSLLQLVLLRHMPYKGYIAFQLPRNAVPDEALLAHAPGPAAAAASGAGSASPPARRDPSRGPGATLSYRAAAPGGGDGSWVWAQFSWLKDDQKAARTRMALVSVASAALFRTTVEDNVACATTTSCTSSDVREACRRVGAHDAIMTLPEAYRTLVGDGSGATIAWPLLLQLTFARALVRRPRLLLLDDAEQFAAALGLARMRQLLAELQQEGVTIILAAGAAPERFAAGADGGGLRAGVFVLEEGSLHTVAPPEAAVG